MTFTEKVVRLRRRSLDPLGEDVVRYKGGSTTIVQPAERTPEEVDLLKKQNELLEIQLGEMRRQNDAYAEVFPQQKELLKAQVDIGMAQVDLWKKTIGTLEPSETQQEIQRLSEEQALRTLRGEAPLLSPQQEAQIETYYGAAKVQGQRDIRQFAEEMAASRGLRLTDTPIGAEVLGREKEFVQALEGAKAGAKLNVGQAEHAFTQGVAQFQENLRQQAFQNRLSLMGRGTSPALPSGGNISSLVSQALDTAARTRGRTETATGPGFNWAGTIQPAATVTAATLPLIFPS